MKCSFNYFKEILSNILSPSEKATTKRVKEIFTSVEKRRKHPLENANKRITLKNIR